MSTLRKSLVIVHRWTGLTVGLFLVFIALTGALIAYRPHLDPLISRDLLTVPMCDETRSLASLIASARAAHREGVLDTIRIFGADEGATRRAATQIRFKGSGFQDTLYVDPCSARVLGTRPRFGGVLATIEQLHRFRFAEGLDWIPGVVALAFAIVMFCGGIYLWWPRGARTLARAIRLDGRLTGRGRTLDRHRIVGLYAGPIVLLSALTGLPQAYDWFANGLHRAVGSPPPQERPQSLAIEQGVRLSPDALLERARVFVADPRDLTMRFAAKPTDAVEIAAILRDAPHANARSMLYLDAYNGSMLRYTPYAQSSLGNKLYTWTLSWHTGEVGGLLGPLVLVIGALGVAFLGYSGVSSYLRRGTVRTAADRQSVTSLSRS